MKTIPLFTLLLASVVTFGQTTPQNFAFGDNWVVTDGAGRTLPSFEQTGITKNNCYVGMYFNLTHGFWEHNKAVVNFKSRSVMEVLEKDHINLEWNTLDPGQAVFNYWTAEPEDGYVNSSDPWYERRQLIMLGNAGVDYIFIDYTNTIVSWHSLEVTMREICELQKQGYPSPKIVLWTNDHAGQWIGAVTADTIQINDIYNNIYKPGKYKDAWFMLDGKPLIMGPKHLVKNQEIIDFFNWRFMWADQDGPGRWNFMSGYPQKAGKDPEGNIEQLVMMKAFGGAFNTKDKCSTPPIGSSGRLADNYQPPLNELWYNDSLTGKGEFLKEQFKRLPELPSYPRFMTFSQWNEGGAGVWRPSVGEANTFCFYGRELNKATDRWMIDAFNIEYNRDMGPLKNYFTDNYYYQVMNYIRQYKGMQPPQEVSPASTIQIDGAFSEWSNISPVFRDPTGDTKHRSYFDDEKVYLNTNNTGRNDIIESKITYDDSNIYFYVKTNEILTSWQDNNWMILYIDADRDFTTGWNGYDFAINMEIINLNTTTIKSFANEAWEILGTTKFLSSGNELEIVVSKASVGITSNTPQFYFKWIDNQQKLMDIKDVLINGDAAPDRRFSYYFNAAQDNNICQKPFITHEIPGVIEVEDFDLGGQMLAYYDADEINSGGKYRDTEKVDIETCSDGGFNLTSLADGEWLEYTVSIIESGLYQADVAVASVNGNDAFQLLLDGAVISEQLTTPATGGEQKWQNISASIQLPEGTHTLKLFVNKAQGGKINKINFTKISGLVYGKGDGLTAKYYNGEEFNNLVLTRVDPYVFQPREDHGYVPGQDRNYFSIRWTGQVQALTTETYTFSAQYDERCKLLVNGQLLINDWSGEHKSGSGNISLEAGKRYDIILEYSEKISENEIRLDWSTPTIPKQLVPQIQLYSAKLDILGTPAKLSAILNQDGSVKLNWTDNSAGETKFIIERKDGAGEFQQTGIVDFNISTFVDNTVTTPRNARWRVKASDGIAFSVSSNEAYVCWPHPITFEALPDVLSTSLPFNIHAVSDYALPLEFSVLNGPATISGDIVTLTDFRGVITLKTYSAGNDTVCPAEVSKTLNIIHDCRAQTITLDTLADKFADDVAPFELVSSSSVGLPVSFTVEGPASLNNNILTLHGAKGNVKVTAYQTGTYEFCAADTVIRSFQVKLPVNSCTNSDGYITYERWDNVPGNSVSEIPVQTAPAYSSTIISMDAPTNIGDNYGVRISGYLCAPYSGDYTFYVAGDDNVQLSLSTDTDKNNKVKIAFHEGWTAYQEWNLFSTQISDPIELIAGQKYYIEALLKEGVGGDHMSVKWTGPYGIDQIIPGEFLSPSCYPQTISFSSSYTRVSNDMFLISASSSSGLPVSFKVIKGAALMKGDTLVISKSDRITVEASQNGDETTCMASSSLNLFILNKLITDVEAHLDEAITIHPNPASDNLQISNYEFLINGIRIIDVQGRIKLKNDVPFIGSKTIDIKELPTGLYSIHLVTNKGVVMKRFIKQ